MLCFEDFMTTLPGLRDSQRTWSTVCRGIWNHSNVLWAISKSGHISFHDISQTHRGQGVNTQQSLSESSAYMQLWDKQHTLFLLYRDFLQQPYFCLHHFLGTAHQWVTPFLMLQMPISTHPPLNQLSWCGIMRGCISNADWQEVWWKDGLWWNVRVFVFLD